MSQPKVELHVQDYGVITLELDADKAPKSVANFLSYVGKGHYDQTIFHRVIAGFMVQGGGMSVGMKEKKTGELNLGVGYSTVNHVTINTGIKERNMFGTGQELGFNIQKSFAFCFIDPSGA